MAPLINVRPYDGFVYILSPKRGKGVKIGKTRKNPFERARQLSTAVPGDLEVIAYYASMDHAKDERKVHEKLRAKRIEGEHFDVSPFEAVVRTRSALSREPSYLCRKLQKEYEAFVNYNKMRMEARLGQEKIIQLPNQPPGQRMQLSLEVDSLPLLDAVLGS